MKKKNPFAGLFSRKNKPPVPPKDEIPQVVYGPPSWFEPSRKQDHQPKNDDMVELYAPPSFWEQNTDEEPPEDL